jgi:hypothetical protein
MPNLVGFVSFESVKAEAVLLGIDSNRPQAKFGCCAKDSDGDLATVQRKELFQILKLAWNKTRAARVLSDKE